MSDIDDDLLALAGGAVSSDEEDEASMNMSRGDSQSPPPPSKKETPAKGVATKKTPAKKAKARPRSDDSEEEGEAPRSSSSAASSPRSSQSVPMDESDSETERRPTNNAADDDEDKFPVEGLFISHAEKASIMNMREVERETILAERMQEKEKMQQNRLLRQLVEKNEQQKKRSASSAGLDNDERRKTTRVRTKIGGTRVGETNSAMDSLKRARAEKNERTRRHEEDKERRRARSPSYRDEFDDDGDADSEIEWAAPGKSSKPKDKAPEEVKKEDPQAELEDIQRIRLGRSRFGQVCFHPGFEDKMRGCFVRISIGADPETGDNLYRMAVIKGVSTGKEYATDGAHGTIITDQYVTASHGKATRDWPFIACSNSPFTEAEWRRYKTQCANDGLLIPKRSTAQKKIDDLNSLLSHVWTEQEVSAKIERVQRLKSKFQGYDKLQLEREIEEHRALGMHSKADELQAKLETLETPRLAFKTSLTPQKKSSSSTGAVTASNGTASGGAGGDGTANNGGGGGAKLSQQERLAQLNAENRRRNRDVVRKAQLKERAHFERRLERSQSQMSLNGNAAGSGTPAAGASPGGGGGGPGSGASTPARNGGSSTPNSSSQQTQAQKQAPILPHLLKLQQQQSFKDKNSLPTIHKPLMDDDIIGALDLDIDEDILS